MSAVRLTLALALVLAGLLLLMVPALHVSAQDGAPVVRVINLDTEINNVSARYLSGAIDSANEDNVELIVIRIDTPGGSLDSTRDMVSSILGSQAPVVVYVAPEGAQAASAGTFISVAGGLLAMAPATNIGAAAVVDSSGNDLPETLSNKVTQDAAAFIRSIAVERGRNADALELTVTEARAYSATEAVDLNIANLIATDLDDLLQQVNGMAIPAAGGDVVVSTQGAVVHEQDPSFLDGVLSFLSNPNIAFLFISIGSIALFIELLHPGIGFAGVIGVALLILGFTGVGFMDFSWAGVAFLGLAIVLFVLEAQAPGFSYFGASGVVSLVLGGVFLAGRFSGPDLRGSGESVSIWLLVAVGASALTFVVWLLWQIRQAKKAAPYVSDTATGTLVGRDAMVTTRLAPHGEVYLAGETWTAHVADDVPIEKGETVRVVAVEGVSLLVERRHESISVSGGGGTEQSV